TADMPFDRFTVEQFAGDMLPGAGLSQRVATGFHRNTMLNEEGGIDPLEFRFHAVTDRVATTGTVWLGLTLGCAQCHSHKYDPISHAEYYRFLAFLNNADEPELEVPDRSTQTRRREVEREIARLEDQLQSRHPLPALDTQFAAWLKDQRSKTARWTVLRPTKAKGSLPFLTVEGDDAVFVTGDMSKSDTYDLTFHAGLKHVTAIRLEALP